MLSRVQEAMLHKYSPSVPGRSVSPTHIHMSCPNAAASEVARVCATSAFQLRGSWMWQGSGGNRVEPKDHESNRTRWDNSFVFRPRVACGRSLLQNGFPA